MWYPACEFWRAMQPRRNLSLTSVPLGPLTGELFSHVQHVETLGSFVNVVLLLLSDAFW